MQDSGGIFIINKIASFQLHVGLDCLHADNEQGIGWTQENNGKTTLYAIHSDNAGPGQKLEFYLPKIEFSRTTLANVDAFLRSSGAHSRSRGRSNSLWKTSARATAPLIQREAA
jgi:hypothetical protein